MCGIIFEILFGETSIIKDQKVMQRIKNRGPDGTRVLEINLYEEVKAIFCGAVLWMQGPNMTLQPVEAENGILLYNGDIFDKTWDSSISDTQLIMNRLSRHYNDEQLVEEIKLLKGPFSIMYYNKSSGNLLFTRDRIGRNTLLCHKSGNSIVISSSLGRHYKCVEIPANHLYILSLKSLKISQYSWANGNKENETCSVEDWIQALELQQSLPDEQFLFKFENDIDFDNNEGVIKYIEDISKTTKCKHSLWEKLLENHMINETVAKITSLLKESVKIRLDTQPQKCKDCLHTETICQHCAIGILFSGGLDCTILAFLANMFVPTDQSIELLNVAFKKEINTTYDVPDRLTGKQSFEELKMLCPSRKWVFKEINVPKEELEDLQKCVIADLVYPRQTILDESLGSALWFAARGQDEHGVSSCRVLLTGSGADELFGGYTRHRNAYRRHGWPGLNKELHLDWSRISFRNLARDNRVICDHGRQPRMPYLDEDFANYVLKLKPWLKCFPSDDLGNGVGEKLILRLVAFNLGLRTVVTFPKRALQFGSRVANKKEKGSDISKSFL